MELIQVVQDPLITQQVQLFDFSSLVGLAGIPAIQQAVQYLREHWKVSPRFAPVAALVLGVLLNLGLATYLNLDLLDATVLGAFTGAGASLWHLVSKAPNTTPTSTTAIQQVIK